MKPDLASYVTRLLHQCARQLKASLGLPDARYTPVPIRAHQEARLRARKSRRD